MGAPGDCADAGPATLMQPDSAQTATPVRASRLVRIARRERRGIVNSFDGSPQGCDCSPIHPSGTPAAGLCSRSALVAAALPGFVDVQKTALSQTAQLLGGLTDKRIEFLADCGAQRLSSSLRIAMRAADR